MLPLWRLAMEQVLEIEADSLEETRRIAGERIPTGFHFWNEEVLEDGKPKSVAASADTEDAALAAAQALVAAAVQGGKATTISSQIRVPPGRRTIETEAWDEASARKQAEGKIDRTARIEASRIKRPGKPGFLGLGRKPALYEIDVFQCAVAAAEYKVPARIRWHVGDSRIPEEGFCQMCGSRNGRARRSKGKANYFCSDSCASEYTKAVIRDAMSGALIIGISAQQYDQLQAAAAGDRAHCWSCGRSMKMSAKQCPACGKDQHPEA